MTDNESSLLLHPGLAVTGICGSETSWRADSSVSLQKASALNTSLALPLVGEHAHDDSRNREKMCCLEGVNTHSPLQPQFLPMTGLRLHFLVSPCSCFIKLAMERLSSSNNVYLPGRVGLHFSKGPWALPEWNSSFWNWRHNSCMSLVALFADGVFPTLFIGAVGALGIYFLREVAILHQQTYSFQLQSGGRVQAAKHSLFPLDFSLTDNGWLLKTRLVAGKEFSHTPRKLSGWIAAEIFVRKSVPRVQYCFHSSCSAFLAPDWAVLS